MTNRNKRKVIGFHLPEEIHGCFSNWYPAKFTVDGIEYVNAEQYMMRQKVLLAGETHLAEKIMKETDPEVIKKYGGPKYFTTFGNIKDIWDANCKEIVKKGVRAKFLQNMDMLYELLATEDAILCECSRSDRIWGIGINLHDSSWKDVENWQGKNYLGEILMEIRSEVYKIFRGSVPLMIADAVGVPVEFMSRSSLKKNPVTDMRAFGTHHQPQGTWSDDSSMALATLASITEKQAIDYEDIMKRFADWSKNGAYTPFNEVFDMGIATHQAIRRYQKGTNPLLCGGTSEYDNGNGSLMRILPVCLYLCKSENKPSPDLESHEEALEETLQIVHNVSALTHRHLRSQMACGIYYFLVKAIEEGREESREAETQNLYDLLQNAINQAFTFYRKDVANQAELKHYERLENLDYFKALPEKEIQSSGYVVSTLEAAIWCLLNTDSYKDAILKAVNLGEDTDTVAAVTGGLAGLYYGFKEIPYEWFMALQNKEMIIDLI